MSARDDAPATTAPFSDEAEQAVLGALMLDNLAVERVGSLLLPEHFYRADHRAMYTTIMRLLSAGKAADVLTVFEAGGHDLRYCNEVVCSVPGSANVHRYAAIVHSRAIERAMVREAEQVIALAHQPGTEIDDKVDQAQARFAKLAERKRSNDPVGSAAAALELVNYVTAMSEGKNPAISTGLRAWDRATAGGIRRGELWVIGARPKMGKTALTLALQRNMSVDHGTLFLSQEMPVLQLTMRHAAALGSMNMNALRLPRADDRQLWERLVESTEQIARLNMVQDSQGGLTLLDVRRKVMAAKRQHGIDVVFVDYLQLMVGTGENRNAELDRVSNGLKAMALEFDVGVVLLSQLNRKADERSGAPVMADLRDSGAIEAAADLIGMLYRDAARNPTPENQQHACLEIVAQRNGPTDKVHLRFVGEFQQFSDWGDEPLPRRGRAAAGGYSAD